MKAIGYTSNELPTQEGVFVEFDAPLPRLGTYDILVAVKAIAINPVDIKVQQNFPAKPSPKIIGYDCAGVVVDKGTKVSQFALGDEVFYAGDITRNGTNAQFHMVDERIVGMKPKTLSFLAAAAMPLTSITAWEIMYDSLHLNTTPTLGKHILIIGGAGGVGSMLIQMVKQLTDLTIITTASREQTHSWVDSMGADIIITHKESITEQLAQLHISPEMVVSLRGTAQHFTDIIECIAPRGHLVIIDDPQGVDINLGKKKSLHFHWEFMFTRSMFHTQDMAVQGQLLNEVSQLVDNNILRTTMTSDLGVLSVANIIRGHTLQQSGSVIGKNVLSGFA